MQDFDQESDLTRIIFENLSLANLCRVNQEARRPFGR